MLSKRVRIGLIIVGVILSVVAPASSSAIGMLFGGSYDVTPGVTYQAPSGPEIVVNEQTAIKDGNPFPASDTVELGKATFSSSARTYATVDQLNGTWTKLSAMDVSNGTLVVNPNDKSKVGVAGDAETLEFRDISIAQKDDGETDLVYGGTSGTTTLTLYGLSPNTRVQAIDLGSDSTLGTAETSSDGTATFSGLSNSEHSVDFRVQNNPPYVGSASPIGGTYLDDRNVTLSATVRDPGGGTIDVEVYFRNQTSGNMEQVNTATVSSGTTVETDVDAAYGSNEWYVRLTGDDGEVTESARYSFKTSGAVNIYNGSTDPYALLDDRPVDVVLQSVDSDYRRETTVSNGILDLEGAPDEELRLTLNATNFSQRTLTFDTPSENVSTVLYPSADSGLEGANATYDQTFALNDRTGQYPSTETTLVVEEYFDGAWQTVASDTFGGENIATVSMRDGVTYRLTVRNGEGDIRSLSTFDGALEKGQTTIQLTIEGTATSDSPMNDLGYRWNATLIEQENSDDYIRFSYDTENETEVRDFTVRIYELGNESNEIYTNNYGLVNSMVLTQPLTEEQSKQTWVVEWTGSIDGEEVTGKRVLGRGSQPLGIPVSPIWKHTASVGMLIIFGGLFGGVRPELGAVVIALLGGILWFVGWLPPAVGGGAIVLALGIAIMYYASRSGGVPR